MNANKQFDFYNPDSMYYGNSKHYIAQLEAMSRQQQAEIEALKDKLHLTQQSLLIIKGWTKFKDEWIPLYTHPVKELDRELLDKTIIDQQNEIKDLRKNLDVALMIVNKQELTDEDAKQKLIRIMGTFDLATGHADTFDELLDSLKVELRDVLGYYREALRKAQEK